MIPSPRVSEFVSVSIQSYLRQIAESWRDTVDANLAAPLEFEAVKLGRPPKFSNKVSSGIGYGARFMAICNIDIGMLLLRS